MLHLLSLPGLYYSSCQAHRKRAWLSLGWFSPRCLEASVMDIYMRAEGRWFQKPEGLLHVK